MILAFNVRPVGDARQLAEREGVEIRSYAVIYRAIEELRAAMQGMLEPDEVESTLGQAEVRQLFRASRIGMIAGSHVSEGKVTRGARVRVVREGTVIYDTTIASLRRFNEDAREVAAGFECGIVLTNFQDLREGDVLETYETRQVERELEPDGRRLRNATCGVGWTDRMSAGRMRRVDEAIRQVIGDAVAGELKDPRVGFVTVTDVRTSSDLQPCARIRERARRASEQREETLAGCAARTATCSGASPRELRLKRTPTLEFVYDDTDRPRDAPGGSCWSEPRATGERVSDGDRAAASVDARAGARADPRATRASCWPRTRTPTATRSARCWRCTGCSPRSARTR